MVFGQTFECLMSIIFNLFVFQVLKLEIVPNFKMILLELE